MESTVAKIKADKMTMFRVNHTFTSLQNDVLGLSH